MRPESRQRGFGLVAAMFLIIIVALLIAAMARLSSSQHGTNSLAIQQARAYQAARAGLEWGITQAINAGICAAGTPSLANSNLSDFSVAVTCSPNNYTDDDGSTVQIFSFVASAQNAVAPNSRTDYAYRRLTAVVEK
jgi:MSHA biogenesis protein MshP